jgi:hypothetical protein
MSSLREPRECPEGAGDEAYIFGDRKSLLCCPLRGRSLVTECARANLWTHAIAHCTHSAEFSKVEGSITGTVEGTRKGTVQCMKEASEDGTHDDTNKGTKAGAKNGCKETRQLKIRWLADLAGADEACCRDANLRASNVGVVIRSGPDTLCLHRARSGDSQWRSTASRLTRRHAALHDRSTFRYDGRYQTRYQVRYHSGCQEGYQRS